MKKLVLVTNDLPGAGKSTLTEVLFSKLSREGLPTALAATHHSDDADERLSPSPNVVPWDFEEDKDLSSLIGLIDENAAVIVDVGTGDTSELHEFSERTNLFDLLGELGVELTLAIPYSGGEEQIDSIVEIAEAFSDNADYVVLRSRTEAEDLWKGSCAEKAMKHLSGIEVTAPPVNETITKELEAHGCSLSEALVSSNGISAKAVTALKKWARNFGDKIDSEAHDYIFPEEAENRVLGSYSKDRAVTA